MPAEITYDLDRLVSVYIKIRDKKAEVQAALNSKSRKRSLTLSSKR
jgi:hypothetical protein